MDKQDIKILQALALNARVPAASIARRVNLSLPAVTSRLRKLDSAGIIDRYTIRINREKMNLHLMAFIQVWVDHTKASTVKEQLISLSEVLECHHAAGDYDLLLKVLVKDTAQLEILLVSKIKAIKAITRTSTTIILNTYKDEINARTEL